MATYILTGGDDVINGTSSSDIFDGYYKGVSKGYDQLTGGAGDDRFIIRSDDFFSGGMFSLAGGDGRDSFFIEMNTGYVSVDGGLGVDTYRTVSGFHAGTDIRNVEILEIYSDRISASISDLSSFKQIFAPVSQSGRINVFLSGWGGTVDLSTSMEASLSVSINASAADAVRITGTRNADDINGTHFDDVLNGAGGADYLAGGSGADVYVVTSGLDTIVEHDYDRDIDTVRTSISLTLAANVERLVLIGSAAIAGNGNGLSNVIDGSLNTAANALRGQGGNDAYIVGRGDIVHEKAGEGIDVVYSSIGHALAANVEKLVLTGTAAIAGNGNALANTITGNAAANRLGGGDGNDRLKGGAGQDALSGGNGNDIFDLEDGADTIVDSSGTDTITTTIGRDLTKYAAVENLVLYGAAAASGYGNNLNNALYGNIAANWLSGSNGNDMLYGGAGNDTLTGGAGHDTFVFNTALNAVTNVDVLRDFSVAADTILLDNAVMAGLGLATGTLAAGKFWKSTSGLAHDADDRIIYETDTGKLFYDANGKASGGAVHIATLAANLALTNADFVVI